MWIPLDPPSVSVGVLLTAPLILGQFLAGLVGGFGERLREFRQDRAKQEADRQSNEQRMLELLAGSDALAPELRATALSALVQSAGQKAPRNLFDKLFKTAEGSPMTGTLQGLIDRALAEERGAGAGAQSTSATRQPASAAPRPPASQPAALPPFSPVELGSPPPRLGASPTGQTASGGAPTAGGPVVPAQARTAQGAAGGPAVTPPPGLPLSAPPPNVPATGVSRLFAPGPQELSPFEETYQRELAQRMVGEQFPDQAPPDAFTNIGDPFQAPDGQWYQPRVGSRTNEVVNIPIAAPAETGPTETFSTVGDPVTINGRAYIQRIGQRTNQLELVPVIQNPEDADLPTISETQLFGIATGAITSPIMTADQARDILTAQEQQAGRLAAARATTDAGTERERFLARAAARQGLAVSDLSQEQESQILTDYERIAQATSPNAIGEIDFPTPPDDQKLWNRAGILTTGVLSVVPRVIGPPTGLLEQQTQNRTAFSLAKNTLIRSMQENPRLAVAERNAIADAVEIEPGILSSPDTLRARMKEVDRFLREFIVRRRNERDFASVNAAKQFLAEMGVPADERLPSSAASPSSTRRDIQLSPPAEFTDDLSLPIYQGPNGPTLTRPGAP